MPDLQPPRHIPTLPDGDSRNSTQISHSWDIERINYWAFWNEAAVAFR